VNGIKVNYKTNKNGRKTVKRVKKLVLAGAILAGVSSTLTGCSEESNTASYNVSQAAHNFEVLRRCIFYNGITGEYILTIEGKLSVVESQTQNRLAVIVKTGPNTYKKHYLGLSDNVSYFVEQLEPVPADPFRYRVFYRPESIILDIEK
jgi:hypothetical protein